MELEAAALRISSAYFFDRLAISHNISVYLSHQQRLHRLVMVASAALVLDGAHENYAQNS